MVMLLEILCAVAFICVFKFFITLCKKSNEKEKCRLFLSGKSRRIRVFMNLPCDVICDITNDFGKYYAKCAFQKNNLVCIIPICGDYNKEYEDVNKFNEFVSKFVNFLNIVNGKVILSSENDFYNEEGHDINGDDEGNGENGGSGEYEEKVERGKIKLIKSTICNEYASITVCVVNYNKDAKKQLDVYFKNKKNYINTIVSNLLLYTRECFNTPHNNSNKKNNINATTGNNTTNSSNISYNNEKGNYKTSEDYDTGKTKSKINDDMSTTERKKWYSNYTMNLPNNMNYFNINNKLEHFVESLNIKDDFCNLFHSHIHIMMRNFSYFYSFMEKSNNGAFLIMYIHDDTSFSKLFNPLANIFHNLLLEKIQKDKKKIKVQKFYTFVNRICNNKKIVTFAVSRLEQNVLFNTYYRLYEFFYYYFILSFGKRTGINKV